MNVPRHSLVTRGALVGALAIATFAVPSARADATNIPPDARRITDPAAIAATARATAAAHTGRSDPAALDVRAPDPRLRLPACETPLAGAVAPGTRSPTQLTVEVSCARPAWRHYAQVRLRVQEPVVVATRPIPRGQAIDAADLEVATRDLSALSAGYFRTPELVAGRVAQRAIGAGEAIAPSSTKAPAVVRRGQQVTLLARASGVQVRVDAVALGDGGVADRVRVRNAATGRQVEGVVRSAGVVEVALQ